MILYVGRYIDEVIIDNYNYDEIIDMEMDLIWENFINSYQSMCRPFKVNMKYITSQKPLFIDCYYTYLLETRFFNLHVQHYIQKNTPVIQINKRYIWDEFLKFSHHIIPNKYLSSKKDRCLSLLLPEIK